VILEAPAMELLRAQREEQHHGVFRDMTKAYFAYFSGGAPAAIAAMVDFYGGPGTFASWPSRVRAYAEQTTAVNILDWASAYGFPLSAAALAAIRIPVLVARGSASHPAMQCANAILSEYIDQAALVTIDGAAHFMIATHATEVAHLIAQHVLRAELRQTAFRQRDICL
jgi:pimeloyl-ACP methyl ester carboxylesterase